MKTTTTATKTHEPAGLFGVPPAFSSNGRSRRACLLFAVALGLVQLSVSASASGSAGTYIGAGFRDGGVVPPAVRLELRVRLDPGAGRLDAEASVDVPREFARAASAQDREPASPFVEFALNPALRPEGAPDGEAREPRSAGSGAWRMNVADPEARAPRRSFRLAWSGELPSSITSEAVALSGGDLWVPTFGGALMTFRLTVDLPEGWDAVSQGVRERHEVVDGRRIVTWRCDHPMDDVQLVAAEFHETVREGDGLTSYAFLRTPDPDLAERYLGVTEDYVRMYSGLLGPYPYEKFAVVENFWQTGYGMPSFTLLGSQVIRLPFLLHTSYPHEILHNWWGNSVYVDPVRGNWCEGLTAYLSDHLFQEARSAAAGAEYRRDTLRKYRDYVRGGNEMPLAAFRSRHSEASQAVGYGKCLFLFHQLRLLGGNERFVAALRTLYADFRFRRASFEDVERVFSAAYERDLGPFFTQWLDRTGAPELALASAEATPLADGPAGLDGDSGWRVDVTLRQVQESAPYDLRVPIAIAIEGRGEAVVRTVPIAKPEADVSFDVPGRPLALFVDPESDVFRRLDRAEIPTSLGQVFGAKRAMLVLPEEDRDAWRVMADSWAGSSTGSGRRLRARPGWDDTVIVGEEEIDALPVDCAVWILGATNRHRVAIAAALRAAGVHPTDDAFDIAGRRFPLAGHSFVFTAPHPTSEELALGWIVADGVEAVPGLERKLPHYSKYSWLAFEGTAPDNVGKGAFGGSGASLSAGFAADGSASMPAPSSAWSSLRLPARGALARP